jgi:hypothetical protein
MPVPQIVKLEAEQLRDDVNEGALFRVVLVGYANAALGVFQRGRPSGGPRVDAEEFIAVVGFLQGRAETFLLGVVGVRLSADDDRDDVFPSADVDEVPDLVVDPVFLSV